LQQWYHQPGLELNGDDREISSVALLALRGEAGQRALIAWSMGWKPAQEISGTRWLVPYLAQLLNDPYSAVRYIAYRSLKHIPGFAPGSYDFVGRPDQRAGAAQEVLQTWQHSPAAAPAAAGARVLLGPSGALQAAQFQRLLRARDDRPMDLQE
jgi:hypothetical protein